MMREILFRGKVKDADISEHIYFQGQFVCGCLLKDGDKRIIHDENVGVFVDPATVGQYTGLKDKEGTKIFEGDRVKGWVHDPGKIFTVAFIASKYACEFVATDNDQCNPHVKLWYEGFEVIGNIHDK